jgi:signal transduction histidine kinase
VPQRINEQLLPFEQIERAFTECAARPVVPSDGRAQAWQRTAAVIDAEGAGASALGTSLLAFAGELFAVYAVELATELPRLTRLVDEIEIAVGLPRSVVGRELLRLPQLLELPSAVAIDVELAVMLALTHSRGVSLWTLWPSGDLRSIAHAGEFDSSGFNVRQLVRTLLGGGSADPHDNEIAGTTVDRWPQPSAALVALGPCAASAEQTSLLEVAVPMLRVMLERDELLARAAGSEHAALASTERRLARLRFDLHDGPQQDLMLLGEDLQLFRRQLNSVMSGHADRERLLGRLEDLQARIIALDGDVRRISVLVQSPFLAEPLPDALAQITDDFATRTGIEPELQLLGDLTGLTDSQQIALLSLIRESLNNIREHSDATHVTLTLTATEAGIEATVVDDGRGFDPEATLVRAARDGHLGLVGMHERVRMLGGRTSIDSRPGGPTVISVSLPSATASLPPTVG